MPTPTPPSGEGLGPFARRTDPDRYFCALFAPAPQRETLFTLIAFNHELARACEVTRDPGLALIRLQWWREAIEGAARAHEVAAPLHAAVQDGRLQAAPLHAMIAARETEAEASMPTLAAWTAWLEQGAGSLAVAAARALGAPAAGAETVRAPGAGYGAAGQLRNVAALARQGRCLLPEDTLAAAGLSPADVIADPGSLALAPVRATLAATGRTLLGPPAARSRAWLPATLPAVLARRDLAQPDRAHTASPRGLADRAAVLAAFLAGRA